MKQNKGFFPEEQFQMRKALDMAGEGVFAVNHKYRIIYCNKEFCRLFKKDKKQIINKKCYEFFHGLKHKPAWCLINRAKKLRRKQQIEYYDRRLNKWLLITGNSYCGKKGIFLPVNLHTVRDITKRKQAEKKLRLAKERIELIYETAPSAIFTVDKKQRVTSWNRQAEKITGYSSKEAIGKKCHLFALKPCTAKCGLYSEDIAKPLFGKVCVITTKNGNERTILKNIDYLRNGNGGTIGGIESFEDITGLKRSEEELQKAHDELERKVKERTEALLLSRQKIQNQNEFLENVLNSLSYPFYVIDAKDYTVKLANAAACSQKKLAKGTPCYALTHRRKTPCSEGKEACPLEEVKRTKKRSVAVHIHDDKKGKRRYVEVHGFPLFDEKGDVTEMIEYCIDISEQRKLELMKEHLIRDVSHELKTPVAMAEMAYDMCQRAIKAGDFERIKKSQQIALENLKRLHGDVETIPQMLSLDQRKTVVPAENISLTRLVKDIYKSVEYLFAKKGIQLDIDIHKEADRIFVGEKGMRILLYNLIDNALKFTQKGRISVTARRAGEKWVRLRIKDTGCGIPPKDIDKVFERFHQRHAAVPGTGLGLSICKEIAELNGGSIKISSAGEGRGATVSVKLPRRGMGRQFNGRR